MRFDTLSEWLGWQQQLHPASIDLGLDRCGLVADRMRLRPCGSKLVSVAGTNGKGSCVAFMESTLIAAGLRVGSYLSPHLLRYNERIRIAGQDVTDKKLLSAFAEVDDARGDVSLTYFEFGTLAAMTLFRDARVDVALLEVGLGGRLDAVNLFDADVSVLTSIEVDHTDWLGPDRESVGFEKAGILRAGRPAVCGDSAPPASVISRVAELDVPYHQLHRDFNIESDGAVISWWSRERKIKDIPVPRLSGSHQLDNAAVAIAAVDLLGVLESPEPVRQGIPDATLPGRFQILQHNPRIIVDVAHNPHAARALAEQLRAGHSPGATFGFVGMLKDKDVASVLEIMSDVVDHWHIAGVEQPRGADRAYMQRNVAPLSLKGTPVFHDQVATGYLEARRRLGPTDRLIAFGSFYIAAHVLQVETSR